MTHAEEVERQPWQPTSRGSICTPNGYCVAIKPKLLTDDEWVPIAKHICGLHNNWRRQP